MWHALSSITMILALAGPAVAQLPCATFDPDQHWTNDQRQQFWFKTQGSRLMPYDWFIALEEPSSTTLLKQSLQDYGFIPASQSTANPGALPIGFSHDGTGHDAQVGLTCAACHTSRIVFKGSPFVIDGAATLADFEHFMKTLEQAMRHTVADTATFDRFATRVFGANPPPGDAAQLRRAVGDAAAALGARWNAYWPQPPTGPGRVDAFGQIYNQVASYDIQVPENARVADAPVSYPFLWNTPQLDKVQWNGSASNRLILGLGPLARNTGEALGVFGEVTIKKSGRYPNYQSSIDVGNLKALERMLKTLRPPRWPIGCAPVDGGRVEAGRRLYGNMCIHCHKVIDRADLATRVKVKMVDIARVRTDSSMVDNFSNRFLEHNVKTGVLKGQPKILVAPKFQDLAEGQEILTNVIVGTLVGGGAFDVTGPSPLTTGQRRSAGVTAQRAMVEGAFLSAMRQAKESNQKYKARPLVGVWATAPYLHNGSVPTLADLLKPDSCSAVEPSKSAGCQPRPTTFYVGNTEFDFVNVGFSTAPSTGAVLFDTTKKGNSNHGHSGPEFGTALSEAEKGDLLEYLKVVGERRPTNRTRQAVQQKTAR